jgi:ABC-2 type transport system permease protein
VNASVLQALLYLRVVSAGNWLVSRLSRLRQPKYFFGAIVGLAYFYFFFVRSFAPRGSTRSFAAMPAADPATLSLSAEAQLMILVFGALLLLVIVTLMWVVPNPRPALGFSEAEIAFLFPAPISRRALVHFQLASAQLRSLAGAAAMALFTNRWGFLGGTAVTHAAGWWFIFSALNLHFNGVCSTLNGLVDRGRRAWLRRILVVLVVAGIIAATFQLHPVLQNWPELDAELSIEPIGRWLLALCEAAPFSLLLWPFRTILGPFLAADHAAFFRALPPALLVIAAHYLWVVRSTVAFEETAIDDAAKRAELRERVANSGRRFGGSPARPRSGPFRLGGRGRPELALLWKNLISTSPYFSLRILIIAAVAIVLGNHWLERQPVDQTLRPILATLAAVFAGYALIVGPQFARQDLRSDLRHVDILKAYPLRGWQVVLGEILTPTAILTGIIWLAVLLLALTLPDRGRNWIWLTPPLRLGASLGVAAIVPALVSLQLLVPNAAALYFPGWVETTRSRGGGPEVVGQRMIFFFAQTITMVLALIPALIVGAVPFALAHQAGIESTPALLGCIAVASLLMVVVLLAEVAVGVRMIGARFEELDLSAELRP